MEIRRATVWLGCALLLAAAAPPGAPRPQVSAAAPPAEAIARARALLRAGDPQAAESLLRPLVEADPRNGAARLLLGRIALERGELEAAREELEIAATSAPPQPFLAWHLLGRVQLLLGEPAAAGASWSRALDLAPRFAPALLGRARAALRLEAPERAAADLERARSLRGPLPEATLLLAELRLFQGRFADAAILLRELAPETATPEAGRAAGLLLLAARGGQEAADELRRLLAEDLHLARGLLAFGVARLRAGPPEAAISAFRAALEMDDDDPVPWLFLRRLVGDGALASYPAPFPDLAAQLAAARRLQEQRQDSRARELVLAVLERRPYHAAAQLLLTLDAERQEDPWAALAGYRRLLEWLPRLPGLEARAARVARSMGALELAGCLAERALEALPEDPALHYLLAVVRSDAGQHAAAAAGCRRALALGLEEPPVYLTLGLAELESMRIPESVAAFSRALELDPATSRAIPRLALASLGAAELKTLRALMEAGLGTAAEDADTLANLAALSLRDNDLDAARGWFERLAALSPDDPQAWYNLGLIHLRQGERQRGEAALDRFRRLKTAEDEQWLAHNRAHALRLEARDAVAGGDPEKALAIYGDLAAAGTADVEDYLNAGQLCLEIGDPPRARGWFDRVLAGNPYQPQALAGLAAAAEALGRTEEARQARDRLALLAWPCDAAPAPRPDLRTDPPPP